MALIVKKIHDDPTNSHLFLKDSGKRDLLRALKLTSIPSTRATFSPFVTYTGFWVRHTSDLRKRIVALKKELFDLSVKKRKPSSDFSWSSLLSSHFSYTSLKNSWTESTLQAGLYWRNKTANCEKYSALLPCHYICFPEVLSHPFSPLLLQSNVGHSMNVVLFRCLLFTLNWTLLPSRSSAVVSPRFGSNHKSLSSWCFAYSDADGTQVLDLWVSLWSLWHCPGSGGHDHTCPSSPGNDDNHWIKWTWLLYCYNILYLNQLW